MELISAIWGLFLAVAKGMLKLWPSWIWIPPVMALLFWFKSPKQKGKSGESRVFRLLKSLPDDKYFILNDILLKTDEGASQIDHIVVSVYGIFVIETKNYQGRIYGSEKSYNWTQNIYGNKQSFKNPIHQNYGHVKAIEKALSCYGCLPIHSIVAFSEQAELHIESSEVPVIYIREIAARIKELSTGEVVSEALAKEIFDTLSEKNITEKGKRKKHISEAKSKKYSNEEKSKNGICPHCGGNLVVRYGRTGQFIGCSNYPKCRYTENVKWF